MNQMAYQDVTEENEAVNSVLQLKHTKDMSEQERHTYDEWQRLRNDFENGLAQIERAIAGDAMQIEISIEVIHEAAENLRELLPEIKRIAHSLEDQEWKTTMERIPR